jgi:hypothetical protein
MAGQAFAVTHVPTVWTQIQTQRLSGHLQLGDSRQSWSLFFSGGTFVVCHGRAASVSAVAAVDGSVGASVAGGVGVAGSCGLGV